MKPDRVGTLIETLRLGTVLPSDLGARWAEAPLGALPALIAYEGAEIWLYRRLIALELLGALPEGVRNRLKQQALGTAARGLHVEEEARAVLRLLAQRRVPVILIKGMARRALAPGYPYLDARPTNDVDLLLPEDRIQEAYTMLLGAGYAPADVKSPGPHHHHLPTLIGERSIPVELHRSTSARVPPTEAWRRASDGPRLDWHGMPVQVPPLMELAWAAAAHALVDNIVLGFRLQHFLEVAALEAGGIILDPGLVRERCRGGEIYEDATGLEYPITLMERWLDGVRQLVGPPGRSESTRGRLDLKALLAWRLAVLDSRPGIGRALTERMLEEGPRALLGLGWQGVEGPAAGFKRLRRHTAAIGSRMLFHTWRATRGG